MNHNDDEKQKKCKREKDLAYDPTREIEKFVEKIAKKNVNNKEHIENLSKNFKGIEKVEDVKHKDDVEGYKKHIVRTLEDDDTLGYFENKSGKEKYYNPKTNTFICIDKLEPSLSTCYRPNRKGKYIEDDFNRCGDKKRSPKLVRGGYRGLNGKKRGLRRFYEKNQAVKGPKQTKSFGKAFRLGEVCSFGREIER